MNCLVREGPDFGANPAGMLGGLTKWANHGAGRGLWGLLEGLHGDAKWTE